MYVCMNEWMNEMNEMNERNEMNEMNEMNGMNEWMNEWRTYVMNNMEKWGALTRFQQKK